LIHNFFSHFTSTGLFFYFFVIGASIGSFINVINYRLPILIFNSFQEEAKTYLQDEGYKIKEPKKEPPFFKGISGRSACPTCKFPIKARYNIPIFGWLILKGKSACCNSKISPSYPIVEFLFAVVFSFLTLQYEIKDALTLMFMFTCLFSLSWIDLKNQIIPDSLSGLLLLFPLFFPLLIGLDLQNTIYASAYVLFLLILVNFIIEKILNKTFIGFGDIKLLTILTLWIGDYGIALVFIISPIILVIYSMLFNRKKIEKGVPFGPWISVVAFAIFALGKANYVDIF